MSVFLIPLRSGGGAARRTSVLCSKTLAQGGIHFRRANENKGSPGGVSRLGGHDHAMDDIRYFVMSLEQEAPLAVTVVERRRF